MADIGKESEGKIHSVFVSAGRIGTGGVSAMGGAAAKKATGGRVRGLLLPINQTKAQMAIEPTSNFIQGI